MKILFVGLGSIGQRHLRNIKTLFPKTKFLAYRQLNRQFSLNNKNKITSYDLDKKYKLKIYKNYLKALLEKPDAVFICNPTPMHLKFAIIAAKKKINIFIDKPLSDKLNKTNLLKKIVKKNKIYFMVGYQLRFNKCLNFIKKLLEKSELGKLSCANVYNGEFIKDYHKYENYKDTWMSKKNLGGGIINSQIHELDYCMYLFGEPKSVYACGGKKSDLELDVEDHVNSIINFKRENISVNVILDFFQRPSKRYLKIIGTRKSLKWDYYKNLVLINDYKSKKTKKYFFGKFDRNEMFLKQTKFFIKLINKKIKKNISDIDNGINGVKLSNALKDSIKKNYVSFIN